MAQLAPVRALAWGSLAAAILLALLRNALGAKGLDVFIGVLFLVGLVILAGPWLLRQLDRLRS